MSITAGPRAKVKEIAVRWLEHECESREMELRTDYSGRGMYGDECVGIVCGQGEMGVAQLMIVAALGLDDEGLNWNDVLEAFDEGPEMHTDSMGLRTIVYWPSVSVEVKK